jgi:hypothetical protein
MGRIRSVKPEFFSSLTVAGLSYGARLTFIGLWTYADDEGRGLDDHRLIKASVWPLDERVARRSIEDWLKELAAASLITRYVVDGRRLFQVVGWLEHQRIDKPRLSDYPPLEQGHVLDLSTSGLGLVPDASGLDRKGKERDGKGREPLAASRRDELFETIAEECGVDWHELTRSARGSLNRATAELRALSVTPENVSTRAAEYRSRYGADKLTPSALVKHWPELGHVQPSSNGHRETPDERQRRLAGLMERRS